MRKSGVISLILIVLLLLSAGCQSQTNIQEDMNLGKFIFSDLSESITGTASVGKEGIVFDNTVRTPEAVFQKSGFSFSLEEKGNVVFQIKNTTDLTALTFSFITEGDSEWTAFKKAELPIQTTEQFQEFTLDLSGQYGWLGNLVGFKLSSAGITEGSIIIKSMQIQQGGANYPEGLHIGPEEKVYDFKQRTAKGIGMAPDGIMGQWKGQDGKIMFVGSNLGKIFVSAGTATDPFETVEYSSGLVENVDRTAIRYASISQVIQEPTTGMLIGITHLERDLESKNYYAATLGLSVSRDNGDTWSFLGETISQQVPLDAYQTTTRDIANGTIMIADGYLYVYSCDLKEQNNSLASGMSVSRVSLEELYEKTLEDKLPVFHKLKDGKWEEPGWGGNFDDILPEGVAPNFCYVTYNTVLKKYIMVMCQAPYYTQNDGDMMLMMSDSCTDFTKSKPYYIAASTWGEQYPTIIGMEESSQLESGSEFYIYYCKWNAKSTDGTFDWQQLWGTAEYTRRKVTLK